MSSERETLLKELAQLSAAAESVRGGGTAAPAPGTPIRKPSELEVGDIISGVLLGMGNTRQEVRVTGIGGTKRWSEVPVFALGAAIKDYGRYGIKVGDTLPVYWPGSEEYEAYKGLKELTTSRLPLFVRREGAANPDSPVELRNPEVWRLEGTAAHEEVFCDTCGERAVWNYPSHMAKRCQIHRDRALSGDPNDQPYMWETYIAYADNPMDARHFAG